MKVDEKRALIKVGDVLEFSNDEENCFEAVVIQLHKAENFNKLCDVIDISKVGFDTKEELLQVLEEFYPLEKQNKYGVVGIEIKTI